MRGRMLRFPPSNCSAKLRLRSSSVFRSAITQLLSPSEGALRKSDFAQRVYFLLQRDTNLHLKDMFGHGDLDPRLRAALGVILSAVAATPTSIPDVKGMSLKSLLSNLEAMRAGQGEDDSEIDRDTSFALDRRDFTFSPRKNSPVGVEERLTAKDAKNAKFLRGKKETLATTTRMLAQGLKPQLVGCLLRTEGAFS